MEQLLLSQLRLALCCDVFIFVERFDCDEPYKDVLYIGHSFDIPRYLLDAPLLSVTPFISPDAACLLIELGS